MTDIRQQICQLTDDRISAVTDDRYPTANLMNLSTRLTDDRNQIANLSFGLTHARNPTVNLSIGRDGRNPTGNLWVICQFFGIVMTRMVFL